MGRDRIHAELWLPPELDEALDAARKLHGLRYRADIIRHYLARALRQDGLWPPALPPKGGSGAGSQGGGGR